MFTKSLRRAFTLAEVVITLGIIGVVSAMTIPALITDMTNREMEARFNRTYSQLNQIAKAYAAESDMTIPVAVRSGVSMKDIFSSHLKGMSVSSTDMWNSTEEDGKTPSIAIYNKYKNFTGGTVKQICDISGAYADLSGVLYMWNDSPADGENGPIICVDLNGNARPNIIGIDYFLFIPTVDGMVIPMGMEHSNNTTGTSVAYNFFQDKTYCGGSKTNYACAYYAATDTSPNGNGRYWKDYIRKRQF